MHTLTLEVLRNTQLGGDKTTCSFYYDVDMTLRFLEVSHLSSLGMQSPGKFPHVPALPLYQDKLLSTRS